MSVYFPPESYSRDESFSGNFGSGLGQGIQQGIGMALQNMFEEKQLQRKRSQQLEKNTEFAKPLIRKLGLKGQQASDTLELLSQLDPEKQVGAIKSLAESQMYNQFLEEQGVNPEVMSITGQNSQRYQMEDMSQGFPGMEQQQQMGMGQPQGMEQRQQEIRQPIIPQKKSKPSPGKVKIGDVELDKSELPKKYKPIPPIGPLGQAARVQESQRKENSAKLDKFVEPYSDEGKLKSQVNKLKKSKQLIQKQDVGDVRNLITAFLSDHYPSISEWAKTDEQRQLYSLLYDSIRSKELGGSNPSTVEVLLSKARLPLGLYGKEADLKIIDNMLEDAEHSLKKGKFINSLLRYDKNIDVNELKNLLESKVASRDMAEQILDEAGGDPDLAERIAKERGLSF